MEKVRGGLGWPLEFPHYPSGRKDVFFFLNIKFRSSLLKEKNLLGKRRIGLATRISLLPKQGEAGVLGTSLFFGGGMIGAGI